MLKLTVRSDGKCRSRGTAAENDSAFNQLTSDIVWLVSQNVTLADGSTQTVLVPQLYLRRVQGQDVQPTGSLIAGNNVDIQMQGNVNAVAQPQRQRQHQRRQAVHANRQRRPYVFNNGIMNTEKEALVNAAQQSSPEAREQGVYVIINPHTGNPVAEVLTGAWDKLNEITKAALPVSNAAQANIDVRNQAGAQSGVVIEADHSRGTLTSSIATSEQVNQGVTNAAVGSVTFNGAAANAERAAQVLNQATSGQGTLQQATHKNDLVGTVVGGNPETGGQPIGLLEAHGGYTGYLPDPVVNPELRDRTDNVWGPGQISVPVLVLPGSTQKTQQKGEQ